jgi:alkaline phosphatase
MKRKNFILCIYFVLLLQVVLIAKPEKETKPKNIIIMIGDGMGLNQVYSSLLADNTSAFRRFNSIGLSITCSANNLITDSGAGVTALSTGYRTNNRYIGVSPDNKPLKNIFEYAGDMGLATGLVVTCSITHATPAGFIAHVSDRGEEEEIAEMFTESKIDVAIGGGMKFFNSRKDNQDLVARLKKKGYSVISSIEELKKFNGSNKFYAMLEKEALKPADKREYPLSIMVKSAIDRLSKNGKGFILMVEGSQIDWGGHANNKDQVASELQDFSRAVNAALNYAQKDGNTLVVVTADHETGGFSIVGGNLDGTNLDINFGTKSHSANAVGVFSYGPGEDNFRGVYNNYMIGRKLINFLVPTLTWK